MISKPLSRVVAAALFIFSLAALSEDATMMIEQGNKAWSEQKLEQAEKAFRKAVELDPESAQAHTSLAGLLQITSRTNEAIDEYQTAITLDPENARLFLALALSYLHQQSYSAAQYMANEALRLDPDMANAKKLIEYIDAKEDLINRASSADISSQEPMSGGALPAGHPAPAAAAVH